MLDIIDKLRIYLTFVITYIIVFQVTKEKKPDFADPSAKERLSRPERNEKSESKAKKRDRSSSGSSSGSADRNQDIETTGGWVKERVHEKDRARMREKEKIRDKARGRERDINECDSETDKSKSIRVAMRNKESRHSTEVSSLCHPALNIVFSSCVFHTF